MRGVRLPGGSFGIYLIPQSEEGKERKRGIQKGKKSIDFEESTKNGRQDSCRHTISRNYYDKPGTYEVVFEAINANASKRTSAIAKTTVTIEGEESGQSNVPVIEVSTAEVEIPLSAMSATFNLRCSAGWTITSSDSLVSVDPVAGNAGDLYMVKVSVADGASSESMLQIKAGDAYKNVKVVLKQ